MNRNFEKISVLLFILVSMLCGCGEAPVVPNFQRRVVTQVDVICAGDGHQLRRQYTDSEKMETILNYLRRLTVRNLPSQDPGTVSGSYRITLTLSDGSRVSYHQKANRFLQREGSPWQTINPEQALGFEAILESMPSDGDPLSEVK